MVLRPRRIAAATVVAGGLVLLAAPASHAVVDPFALGDCLTHAAIDLTTVVDPSSPGPPAELPAAGCLQP